MMFHFTDIIWFLIKPSHVIVWLFLAALASCFCLRGAWSRNLLALSVIFFLILAVMPTGYNMTHYLETRFERPDSLPENIDGIIVLGGSTNTDLSDAHKIPIVNDSAERLFDFAALAKQFPEAKLVFAGGRKKADLVNTGAHFMSEAHYAESLLSSIGFPTETIIFEDQSKNTYQNIVFSKTLAKPLPRENWILITSAFHMARSKAVFDAQGWKVIPYPADYKTGTHYQLKPLHINMPHNLHLLDIATKEILGKIVYKISGKIK